MKRFGGMVSFRVTGGEQPRSTSATGPRCSPSASRSAASSRLIEHPGRMTHACVAGTDLEVPADLIRLSVGIETVDDLIADLDRALA